MEHPYQSLVEVSATQFDAALDASEETLRELGEQLDAPVRNGYLQRACQGLGVRARSMFIGFQKLIDSDVPAAAFVLLRPATEINLVLRFLVARPEVHLELWEGDADLELVKWIQEIEGDPQLAGLVGWSEVPGLTATLEAEIAKSRALGLKEGVQGVSAKPRGRVMPDMWLIAHNHGDLSTRHAYWAAYRPLSLITHASSRGFTHSEWIDPDGSGSHVTFSEMKDPVNRIRSHRALSAATFASTLTVISDPLNLDVLEVAGRTRDLLVTLQLTEPQL
jgi:hypothetical protein